MVAVIGSAASAGYMACSQMTLDSRVFIVLFVQYDDDDNDVVYSG